MLLDTRFNKITYQIVGCAMAVHRVLGRGFQEVIYQRSLAVELERAYIAFIQKVEMPIFCKDIEVGAAGLIFWWNRKYW